MEYTNCRHAAASGTALRRILAACEYDSFKNHGEGVCKSSHEFYPESIIGRQRIGKAVQGERNELLKHDKYGKRSNDQK